VSSGLAQRFAVEAAFLVLLALAAGFADLEAWMIALVMAAGWLLVSAVEWLAWRADRELEDRLAAGAPRTELAAEPETSHGWDVEEILAPLPEDEGEAQGDAFTGVLPPEEREH
jgi:hypothetical protein